MSPNDPFAVLGIAPTLDAAVVRRAWHAAVRDNPPHREPEAFRRVRDANEALRQPGGLLAAWLAAPFDVDASLAALEAVDAEGRADASAEVAQLRSAAAAAAVIVALPGQFGVWAEAQGVRCSPFAFGTRPQE